MSLSTPYLIDDLQKEGVIRPIILDALKYELDQQIYYYGAQFIKPKEQPLGLAQTLFSDVVDRLKHECKFLISKKPQSGSNRAGKRVLSNAYFSLNKRLIPLGFDVYTPIWWLSRGTPILSSKEISREVFFLRRMFKKASFNQLTAAPFLNRIQRFYSMLQKFFIDQKIAALIVPNDMSFFENLSISICKECKIPSFVSLHGLPGRYNNIDENRADYLMVWGDKIKQNYIQAGVEPRKILVTGHPSYDRKPPKDVRFGLDSILVLTKTMGGVRHSDAVPIVDRGNLIVYLRTIARALRRVGVRGVRLRLHPSENYKWYNKFIDTSFFQIDKDTLSTSLKKASLVIGPTSTVLLEAVFYEVNYLVYEPIVNGVDFAQVPPVTPFDGSDRRVPVAADEETLYKLLMEKRAVDTSFMEDYIKVPFNAAILRELI